eukprot:1553716-Pleurochrysis_carterae.AAC.2
MKQGCSAWAVPLFAAACLRWERGSAGKRCNSVSCRRCEMSLRARLHARTGVGVRAIGWERALASARREQHRSRWHDCAGGGVEDQHEPDRPQRSR